MWTSLVNAGYEESYAVGTPAVVLRVDLGFISDGVDDAGDWNRSVVEETGGHGLLAHEVGEDTGVGGEAGEGNTEVGVDAWGGLVLV